MGKAQGLVLAMVALGQMETAEDNFRISLNDRPVGQETEELQATQPLDLFLTKLPSKVPKSINLKQQAPAPL